jgi:chloramphenicol-sensitive protein RarD
MINSAHLAAIISFSMWGIFPLYWKWLNELEAFDLFGQRLIWSFLTLMGILLFQKKLKVMKGIWSSHRTRYLLILSSILISSNWLIYIYAVQTNKVIEASMGYFLNPLINVFMGWLILKEKIRSTQWPSIVLAGIAIVLIVLQSGFQTFPWIAISLSLTFAGYGLVRKVAHVGALEGLSFETFVILAPVLWYWLQGDSGPITSLAPLPVYKIFGLMLSGFITCIPLMLFAFAARNLPLGTLGFIGYLSPSLKFLCGFVILQETLAPEKLQAFALIWIALAWYTIEAYANQRKIKKKNTIPEI